MKPEYQSRYADLLTGQPDEVLDKLVQELDAVYTAPARPAGLSWGSARQYLELVSPPASDEEAALSPVRPLRGRATRRRKGAFFAVAAVVAVTMLCVTLLALLGTLRFQQNPQQSATLAADAQLLQQLVQSKGTPSNIRQLVQSGQFTSVNLTSRTYDIHIQQVYIDASNVVLLYTVDRDAWIKAIFCNLLQVLQNSCIAGPVLTLKTSTGQTLTETAERADVGKEPAYKNKLVAILAYYDASVIQGNPTQVTLTASLYKKISPSQEKIGEFTSPVHLEKKVINVHQTVSSQGHALTLERVVITPTEARFYYSYQGSLAGSAPTAMVLFGDKTLSIAGKAYDPNPFPAGTNGDAYGWFRSGVPASLHYTSFHETLLDQAGTWIFTQNAAAYKNPNDWHDQPVRFSWKFTFTVS